MQHQIFESSYFFNKPKSSKEVPFKNSYFFTKATFWKQLIFQKSNLQQLTFSEDLKIPEDSQIAHPSENASFKFHDLFFI